MQRLHCLRNLGQRLGKISHIHHKRHNHSETYPAVQSHGSPCDTHCHVTKITDKSHNGHHQSRQTLCLKSTFTQITIHPVKGFPGILLPIIRFHHRMPCVNFLYMPVHLTKMLLLTSKIFLTPSHNGKHGHKSKKTCAYRRERHPNVRHKHHTQTAKKEDNRGNQIPDTLVQ